MRAIASWLMRRNRRTAAKLVLGWAERLDTLGKKARRPSTIIDIVGCARCDGDGHKQLEFKEFTYPCGDWTHWAMCPTLNEPILLGYFEEEE